VEEWKSAGRRANEQFRFSVSPWLRVRLCIRQLRFLGREFHHDHIAVGTGGLGTGEVTGPTLSTLPYMETEGGTKPRTPQSGATQQAAAMAA